MAITSSCELILGYRDLVVDAMTATDIVDFCVGYVDWKLHCREVSQKCFNTLRETRAFDCPVRGDV